MIPADARPARLPGTQALVRRAQEPRHGPRGRRRLGLVHRTQRHPQEELSLRVLLAGRAPADLQLLATWHRLVDGRHLFAGVPSTSISTPSLTTAITPCSSAITSRARTRRQPSVLAFLAQDAEGRAFCYSNADLRKGEEAEEIFRFIAFWKRTHGQNRRTSGLRLPADHLREPGPPGEFGITFITLRRRSATLLHEIAALPRSAWRTIELDVPSRKYRTPRVYEQSVGLAGETSDRSSSATSATTNRRFLLTNDRRTSAAKLITRYAQRMLIENALSDAVRFFHMDALSSAVGLKVDFDMALLVIASGLYRLMAEGCAATPMRKPARSSAI